MKNKKPNIFVIGNEKGGAGKTTCSVHLTVALLYQKYKVVTIDVDTRQGSLTSYFNNREIYNNKNPSQQVPISTHFHIAENPSLERSDQENEQKALLEKIITNSEEIDYIIIDTPGSHTSLSNLAHSYADTIITPINDSFLDLDVLAKVDHKDTIINPSIYSQMIWEQKMQRASRDKGTIEWIIVRNRLSNLDAINKRRVGKVLKDLSKRISFKIADGFSERVIFRELFLHGLTLLDLKIAKYDKVFSVSHVAARQELRNFLNFLEIKSVLF